MKKILLWGWLAASSFACAEVKRLTLEEAIGLALQQNSMLKLAQHKIDESRVKVKEVRANYYPQISNNTGYFYTTELQRLELPAGALGQIPGVGLVPPTTLPVLQGAHNYVLSSTSAGQPLTQIYKIKQGEAVARADSRIAEEGLRKGRQEVELGVQQLYFGLLIYQGQLAAAESKIATAEESLADTANAVQSGNLLAVAQMGRRAQLLEARQAKLALENQVDDLTAELNDITGLPRGTQLSLAPVEDVRMQVLDLPEAVQLASSSNPQVREAEQVVEKARRGVSAAKAEYIPEVTALAQFVAQNGVPFFPAVTGVFGGQLKMDLFDWGKRSSVVRQRQTQLASAEENLRRLRNRVALDVEKSYRKWDRSVRMLQVAKEAEGYRVEAARIAKDQYEAGTATRAIYLEAEAAQASAKADLAGAMLSARLAHAELKRTIGQ